MVSATAPDDSVALLSVALALLGLGWNLGLVAGTAMITDAVPRIHPGEDPGRRRPLRSPARRLRRPLGLIMAAASYSALSIAGGVLALAVVPFVITTSRRAVQPIRRAK